MGQNDNKISHEASSKVSDKTRKANIRLALILGVVVILGMSSTFFMLSEKL